MVHLTMSSTGRIKADAHSVTPAWGREGWEGGGAGELIVSLGKSSSDQCYAAPEMSTLARRGGGSRDHQWRRLVRGRDEP